MPENPIDTTPGCATSLLQGRRAEGNAAYGKAEERVPMLADVIGDGMVAAFTGKSVN